MDGEIQNILVKFTIPGLAKLIFTNLYYPDLDFNHTCKIVGCLHKVIDEKKMLCWGHRCSYDNCHKIGRAHV